MHRRRIAVLVAGAALLAAYAPRAEGDPRKPADVYAESCAACHGADLSGSRAASLLDDAWLFGGDRDSIVRSIRDGRREAGMPGYAEALSEAEIAALAEFIREKVDAANAEQGPSAPAP